MLSAGYVKFFVGERHEIMTALDYTTLILYIVGTFLVGLVTMRSNKNSEDMFAASGHSPWWVAGTSAFM